MKTVFPNHSTQEEVEQLVTPYFGVFERNILAGLNDFVQNDSGTAHIHSKSTKAGMIRNYILSRLKAELSGDPNVRFVKQFGMITIGIQNRVFIRIKKLDRNFRSSNILTEQVKRLRCGTLELMGIKSNLIWLDIGYMLDRTGTSIDSIHAVHPASNRQGYDFKILISDQTTNPDQIRMFVTPEEELVEETPLVTIKPHVTKPTDRKKSAG